MVEALRPFLLGLVLLNLLFVQLTDSVQTTLLLPLYGLSIAAPWLVRLQRHLLYRVVWNLSVVVIFGLLLRHALTTGLLHMLEDGLLLAALCQVHLLNNVGTRQKPDLMFFNSFLIAFITSFFSQDLGWSLTFLAYAALLLPALQLYTVLRDDRVTAPGTIRAVLRDSAPRTLVALAATALAFAVWPRDFQRPGWLGLAGSTMLQVGFGDELRLDRSGPATLSVREVMRIRPPQPDRMLVPTHWRGATFVNFDGVAWTTIADGANTDGNATDLPWQRISPLQWHRPSVHPAEPLEVRLHDLDGQRLFLPLEAGELQNDDEHDAALAYAFTDGTVGWERQFERNYQSQPVRYRVRIAAADPRRPLRTSPFAEQRLRLLDPAELPEALIALAHQLRDLQPPGADAATVAESCRSWLAQNRHYALPGTADAAANLTAFVLNSGGGHCEYFAATLAALLRLQGIACRVATGYLATEWDADKHEVVVRRRDAHAWVEVLLPGRGWITCDATPAADLAVARASATDSVWDKTLSLLSQWWHAVSAFDGKTRDALLIWLIAAPGDALALLFAHPLETTAGGLLLCGVLLLRRRLRRHAPAAVLALRAAARAAGLRPAPGETPRELLARATAAAGLPPPRLAALVQATATHEAARYGDGTAGR